MLPVVAEDHHLVAEEPEPVVGGGPEIVLYRHDFRRTVDIELEVYLLGVVAAEMPATFHPEALRAQAVAARTYALYTLQRGQPLPEAPSAVLSTDHRSAQAWISQDAFWDRWGPEEAAQRWRRIAAAVSSTHGQVLTYGGAPILAAYHSSSGGHTENSENYWSGTTAYLQGRPDPFDAVSPHRDQVTAVSVATLFSRLDLPIPASTANVPIAVAENYPSGRVQSIRIGDYVLTGRQVREGLGLRSSMFSVETRDGMIHFTQQGYGHGIGMSQYGADGMAQQGYTYDQILGYYYSGVQLTQWYD